MLQSRVLTPFAARVMRSLASALALFFVSLSGCDDAQTDNTAVEIEATTPTTTVAAAGTGANPLAVEVASTNLAAALEKTFEEARPVTDQGELSTRLSLPADRLDAFGRVPVTTGGTTTAEEPAAMARNDFWCGPRGCICIGDSDCNDMFSTVCRNPSTGGECRISGRLVVCTCTIGRQS